MGWGCAIYGCGRSGLQRTGLSPKNLVIAFGCCSPFGQGVGSSSYQYRGERQSGAGCGAKGFCRPTAQRNFGIPAALDKLEVLEAYGLSAKFFGAGLARKIG